MVQTTSKTSIKTGGDDLDDGLELDGNLLASSDGEVDSDGGFDEDEVVHDEDEDEGQDTSSEQVAGAKRKAGEDVPDDETEQKKADKKRKRKEKEKDRKAKRGGELDTATARNTPPTQLIPEQFSSLLLASLRESFSSATPMELSDLNIPTENLLPPPQNQAKSDTSSQAPSDPDAVLKALVKRVEGLMKGMNKFSNGTPKVVIISLSGLRCVDVVRAVKGAKGNGEVAKLFAKHMKVAEQVKFLNSTKTSIAVGTPARIAKLISEGALKVTKNTVILLDIGHRDSKTRTLLTLPEIREELWRSVFSGDVRRAILENGAKVGAV